MDDAAGVQLDDGPTYRSWLHGIVVTEIQHRRDYNGPKTLEHAMHAANPYFVVVVFDGASCRLAATTASRPGADGDGGHDACRPSMPPMDPHPVADSPMD